MNVLMTMSNGHTETVVYETQESAAAAGRAWQHENNDNPAWFAQTLVGPASAVVVWQGDTSEVFFTDVTFDPDAHPTPEQWVTMAATESNYSASDIGILLEDCALCGVILGNPAFLG